MINKDDILRLTQGGLSVFRHYLGRDLRPGRKFRNPFYQDTHPSCYLYFDRRTGVYKYKDFGNDLYAGDCFNLVATLHNLSCHDPHEFTEVMRIIDRELNLGIDDTPAKDTRKPVIPAEVISFLPREPEPTPAPYNYRCKPFTEAEARFWDQYRITAQIRERYHVASLEMFSGVSQSGRPYTLRSTPSEPMFAYLRPCGIKGYRPYSASRFFAAGTKPEYYCFGLEQLPATGDVLFITGGEKDVMTLAARGYPAICFGSETVYIPQNVIAELTPRFRRLILLYDCDQTGRKSSLMRQKELAHLGVERIVLPLAGTKQEKDISDFFMRGHTCADFETLYQPASLIARAEVPEITRQ